MRYVLPILLAAATVLAGCTTPEEGGPTTTTPTSTTPDDEPGEIQEVAVEASNYAFDAPSTATSGLIRFTLTNVATDEIHHVQLLKLATGNTSDDVVAFFQLAMNATNDTALPTPPWTEEASGPNAPAPGGNASSIAIVDLEEGSYAYACFIPSSDGIPHVAKGMAAPLNVTAATGNPAEPPEAHVTASLTDFNITLSANLTADNHTIAFVNDGTYSHEAFLARLAEGKTTQDLLAFVGGQAPPGPPPFEPLGGVTSMEPGATVYAEIGITPGNYVLICFDEDGGTVHFARGMILEFTVA